MLWLVAGMAAGEEYQGDVGVFAGTDVLVLGETHDNGAHHARQARIVAEVRPAALVFEMLTPEKALAITPDIRTDPGAIADATGWADSGWPAFIMYYPIFAAAPEAAIFAGDVPRDDVRAAVSDSAAAVFGAGASIFGLDAALPEAQQADREARQMEAHCDALPEAMLPGMVEAQRLRDAALARAVVAALEETGGPVAVITGNGHARTDWGVPALLAQARPDLRVLSLGQFEALPEGEVPHDLWAVSDPAEREDPCAAFR